MEWLCAPRRESMNAARQRIARVVAAKTGWQIINGFCCFLQEEKVGLLPVHETLDLGEGRASLMQEIPAHDFHGGR